MAGPVTNLRALVNANLRTSKRADTVNDVCLFAVPSSRRYTLSEPRSSTPFTANT